jgi:hypothetical protein
MEAEKILLLQFSHSNDRKLDKRAFDRLEAKWLFLGKNDYQEAMAAKIQDVARG